MADLLSIGLTGLRTSQSSLSTTGHNISNVNTPGYSRQQTLQGTQPAQFNGAGYIGSGTTVTDIRRLASEFLTGQVRNTTVVASDVTAYKSQIDQLDGLLAGTVTGINPSLQSFFAALQTSVESPADGPARQLVLSESEGLAKRFNTIYERLDQQNQFINKQMGAIGEQVNRLATSVASYNEAIASAKASGKEPNDLLDARDETLRQLSSLIGVQVIEQDGGAVNVFVGSGQPLVVGASANSIKVTPSPSDPLRMQVEFVSGSSRQAITNQINGGEIGGLIRYRNEALDPVYNSIGRLALSVSDQVNKQLKQGLDLKGDVGVGLFLDINDPSLTGLRSQAWAGNSDSDPQASLNVLISDTSQLTTSDYALEFTSATAYTVRRISDGEPLGPFDTTTTPAPEIDGFSVKVASGTFAAGDRFLLMPTRRGAASIEKVLDQPEQLAFAAPVRAAGNVHNSGTGAIGQPELISESLPVSGLPVTLTYDAAAGTFLLPADVTLTRNPPVPVVPPNTVVPNAFVAGQQNTYELTVGDTKLKLTLSGKPAAGDTFTLSANTNGVSDNRNGLKLADLQNKSVMGVSYDAADKAIPNSGVSFSGSYGDLVERVGTLTAQARVDGEASQILLNQAQNNRDSLSGVNLDEEAANLIQFEQYYNASAQVIQVARSLFDTLLSTFR